MIQQILEDLKSLYKNKPHRLQHVQGVVETAVKLGQIHKVNIEKLKLAAYLHDITKYLDQSEHIEIIKTNYDNAEYILTQYNSKILHAFSARVIAAKKYGIKDTDVLDSIQHHTIGKANMTIYEKIIFISDYIEPNRTYESCLKVREIAFKNLDLAVFTAIDDSIKFYEKEESMIPNESYLARTYYKTLLEENNG